MKAIRLAFLVGLVSTSALAAQAGLVSYWSFDGATTGAGGVADKAATFGGIGGSPGTASGVTIVSPGLIGSGAVSFSGANSQYVSVGASVQGTSGASGGITVEALIKPSWTDTPNVYQEIFRKEDGTSGVNRILFSFQHDGNNATGGDAAVAAGPVLSLGLNEGGTYTELDMPLDGASGRPTLTSLMDGNTHLVVGTYDAATGAKSIYIDGGAAYTVNKGAGSALNNGGTGIAYIGDVGGAGQAFSGTLDEVAIWNNALTSAQIATQWTNVQAGKNFFGVPEPGTFVLAGCGLLGLAAFAIRSRARR